VSKHRNHYNDMMAPHHSHSDMSCCGTKTMLPPVLVAKVYNQTIIEEIPNSAMSMTMNNTACITCAHSEGCSDSGSYVASHFDNTQDDCCTY